MFMCDIFKEICGFRKFIFFVNLVGEYTFHVLTFEKVHELLEGGFGITLGSDFPQDNTFKVMNRVKFCSRNGSPRAISTLVKIIKVEKREKKKLFGFL